MLDFKMTTQKHHIPILRFGQAYQSLDCVDFDWGENGGLTISQANPGMIRRDMRSIAEAQAALQAIPATTLIEYAVNAADIYLESALPCGLGDATQTPEEYVQQLSQLTGLPHTLCRANMGKVAAALKNMPAVIAGLTRGLSPQVFDCGLTQLNDIAINYYPVAQSLGVVLPSNSPGVNSLWLPALVMKVPVVLKPGREDPLTPFRIIQALVAAGFPKEAFGFYPTSHAGGDDLLMTTDRGIMFGNDTTVKKYQQFPDIQVHGAGHSKVLLGEDCAADWQKVLDVLVESVAANGGRSCINASSVFVPNHVEAIAEGLAQQLVKIQPRPREAEDALLCGFANPDFARAINEQIDAHLQEPGAVDVTARYRTGSRLIEAHGQTYLQPTVIAITDPEHPLANTEYMFPFVSVQQMPQAEMLDQIGSTLVVSAITKDRAWINLLLRNSLIDRLNIGPFPTNRVQWEQPHEGNLFEFLYHRRAIQGQLN